MRIAPAASSSSVTLRKGSRRPAPSATIGCSVTPPAMLRRTVAPGSSAQPVRWFGRGVKGGAFDACDTFSAADL